MNRCDGTEPFLSAYFDGECTPEEAAQVRAHLQVCPACRRRLREYALMRRNFPDDSELSVPNSLSANVMSSIRAGSVPRTKRCGNFLRRILLPLAACLTIALALPNSTGRLLQNRYSPTAQVPSASSPCTKSIQKKRAVVRKKIVKQQPERIFSSRRSSLADSAAPNGPPSNLDSAASAAASEVENAAQLSVTDCISCSAPYQKWISVTTDAAGSLLDSFNGATDIDPISGGTATRYELSTADFTSISAQISGATVHVNSSAGLTSCCIYVLSDH